MFTGFRSAVIALGGAALVAAGGGLLSGCAAADADQIGISADTSIELIAGSQGSSFSLSLECGAAQEARRLGVTLTVAAPRTFSAADQEALVNGVIVGNPDALIIDPASTTALNQSLVVAQENDTKIIFVGTHPVDRYLGASLITSRDADGGALAARGLAPLLSGGPSASGRASGLVSGRGTVAIISAPDGGPAALARIGGFRRQLAALDPGLTLLNVQSAAADSAAAAGRLVTGDLAAHPGLAGVLTLTDNATVGAEAALAQAGRTHAVRLATFDAEPLQMSGLATGAIAVTVAAEPAREGAEAVAQAVSAVAEKQVRPQVSTPMVAITARNMSTAAIRPYIYDGTCTSSLRGYMTAGD